MTLSEKVRYVRAKLRLTQKELSKKTGIPRVATNDVHYTYAIIKWETEQTTKPQMSNYGKFIDFCENNGIDLKKVKEFN